MASRALTPSSGRRLSGVERAAVLSAGDGGAREQRERSTECDGDASHDCSGASLSARGEVLALVLEHDGASAHRCEVLLVSECRAVSTARPTGPDLFAHGPFGRSRSARCQQ